MLDNLIGRLTVCPCVCLLACLLVCMSVCMSVCLCLSLCMYVYYLANLLACLPVYLPACLPACSAPLLSDFPWSYPHDTLWCCRQIVAFDDLPPPWPVAACMQFTWRTRAMVRIAAERAKSCDSFMFGRISRNSADFFMFGQISRISSHLKQSLDFPPGASAP